MSERTGSDRFLIILVAGIIILVVVSFFVVLNRPSPQFQPGDSPEDVVQNYLLALQLGDYDRAYATLSEEIAYPDSAETFFDSLRREPWLFTGDDNYSLVIESVEPLGERSAAVSVRLIYSNNTLFGGGGYDERFQMRLVQEADGWRLASGERFWSPCWGEENSCLDDRPLER